MGFKSSTCNVTCERIIIIDPHYTRVQAGPMCELQTVIPPHPILDFKSHTYGIPPPGLSYGINHKGIVWLLREKPA